MDTYYNLLKFIFIIIMSISLLLILIRILNTYIFNNQLEIKKRKMRIIKVENKKQINTKRMKSFKLSYIIPLLLIAIILTSVNLNTDSLIKDSNINSTHKDLKSFNSNSSILNQIEINRKYKLDYTYDESRSYFNNIEYNNTSDASNDYSTTNTQVDGVDEMDTVKTDGEFIYSAYSNVLTVTKAYPYNELEIVKEITIDSNSYYNKISGIYIDENNLTIVSEKTAFDAVTKSYFGYTCVSIYDKTELTIVTIYTLDGYCTGTRKIDDKLYVITTSNLNYDSIKTGSNNKSKDGLTNYYINNDKYTIDYTDIIYFENSDISQFSNIFCININSKEIEVETLLGSYNNNIYITENNIYFVDRITYYDNYLSGVFAKSSITDTTIVCKISINNELQYKSNSVLKGITLNQFSIDEYNGYLRVATTEGNSWSQTNTNNRLYILDTDLNIVSSLSNLGKDNEVIYSVRFIKDFAYIVTYKTVDPFIVIDLSEPTNPVILSELIIPGYSSYLQQYDDNHIIGIGYASDSSGTLTGLKIEVYDVTNKSNALVMYTEIIAFDEYGSSSSSSLYNHKDLLFNKNKDIIGFPLTIRSYTDNIYSYSSGYILYNFDLENGFYESSFIEHNYIPNENEYIEMDSALYIDNYLYCISNHQITVSNLQDPSNIIESVYINEGIY